MSVLNKDELEREKLKVIRNLRKCLFVYPTDTVYGIGCNATDRRLVRKLRRNKEQYDRPLSVIVPNKEWIHENFYIGETEKNWLDKLPGPYTLILKLKNNKAVSRATNLGKGTLGVRIPNHWFSKIVEEMNVPIITTSANVTGETCMNNLSNLNPQIKDACKYVIYDGPIDGKPSKIIDLTKEKAEILRN